MKVEIRDFCNGRFELVVQAEGAMSDRKQYDRERAILETLFGGIVLDADFGNALLIRSRTADDDT